MVQITKDGEKVLREQAQEVPLADIPSPALQKILKDMSTALSTEKFGVAIAAPQIGKSLRIFVVAKKIFKKEMGDTDTETNTTELGKVFINPKILKTSKKMQQSHESCLSIQGRPAKIGPDVAGIVARPDKMLVEAYDEHGVKSQRGASGFLAAIFDHEIDHLNGILFIDKTLDEWEIDEDFNRVT